MFVSSNILKFGDNQNVFKNISITQKFVPKLSFIFHKQNEQTLPFLKLMKIIHQTSN